MRRALVLGAAIVVGGGCRTQAEQERQCVGPLIELVRWRDEREVARTLRGEAIAPAELARQERDKVDATVATLLPRRRACELTWSVLMHQEIDNPGLRLREEALLRVLDLPPRDYAPNAVGWAGVTTQGRVAVGR